MKNIALDTNQTFETIDLAALQDVSGGDAAQRWWDTLKQNATDTYNRYSTAAQSYASSGRNLAQGNFRAAASDLGNGVVNHAAGGLNLLQTVKDATDIIPRP
jgi:hypothetical protein